MSTELRLQMLFIIKKRVRPRFNSRCMGSRASSCGDVATLTVQSLPYVMREAMETQRLSAATLPTLDSAAGCLLRRIPCGFSVADLQAYFVQCEGSESK